MGCDVGRRYCRECSREWKVADLRKDFRNNSAAIAIHLIMALSFAGSAIMWASDVTAIVAVLNAIAVAVTVKRQHAVRAELRELTGLPEARQLPRDPAR